MFKVITKDNLHFFGIEENLLVIVHNENLIRFYDENEKENLKT